MILFIDTETTGIPRDYCQLSEQPYLVQLAACLCDDSRRVIVSMTRIVRPEGWEIPMEATAIHGYTTAHCRRNGVPLVAAMREFQPLWRQADRIVAYNAPFDQTMIELSAERTGTTLPVRETCCAMRLAAKHLSGSRGRWLKLGVAYRQIFGQDFDNAHDAMADVDACRAVYYAILDGKAPAPAAESSRRSTSSAKLQQAIEGSQQIAEHQELINCFVRLHCTHAKRVDWKTAACMPLPPAPQLMHEHERAATAKLAAYRPNLISRMLELDQKQVSQLEQCVEQAKVRDQQDHQEAMEQHRRLIAVLEHRRQMAQQVLSGNTEAYYEAIGGDICDSPLLARNVMHSFADTNAAEVYAYLNGQDIIPSETKKLLASGRVSAKKMANRQFIALYQDHLCSAVLRIACDLLAILPLKQVLIHAYIPVLNTATGCYEEQCIISCIIDRERLASVNLGKVDPSDCISSFRHAMTLKKGALQPVTPISL